MKIEGKTEEGKLVVSGLFELADTKGLPLPISFTLCAINNMVPSPIHFIISALKAGWLEKTIVSKYREGIIEGYDEKFWNKQEQMFLQHLRLLKANER